MQISDNGLQLVKHFEGLYLKAYLDPVDVWTIGYGHTRTAEPGMVITEEEAERLLRGDLSESEEFVEKVVETALKQHQFDALVSFAFNVGNGALGDSTLLRLLNEGRVEDAAAQFSRWVYGTRNGTKIELPGLVRRRKSERHLFATGELSFFNTRAAVFADEADDGPPAASKDSFAATFAGWNIRHFKPFELEVMGSQHGNPHSAAFGKNTLPPSTKWDNIRKTIEMLDAFREKVGAPVQTLSVYRSPDYNKAIGGAKASQHMEFNAIDFAVKGTTLHPAQWASILRDFRAKGMFKGGIGTYASFVHLDTRGENVDW